MSLRFPYYQRSRANPAPVVYLEDSSAEVGCRFSARLTTSVSRSKHSPVTPSPPVDFGEEGVTGECFERETLVVSLAVNRHPTSALESSRYTTGAGFALLRW